MPVETETHLPASDIFDHHVQFYEDDGFLADSLAEFFASTLNAGGSGVVLATPSHRLDLEARLRSQGVDLDRLIRDDRFLAIDAHDLLAACLHAGAVDAEAFCRLIEDVIQRSRRSLTHPALPVRVFGELVAILVAEQNAQAAIELEHLWDQIVDQNKIHLLCAYPMRLFASKQHSELLLQICRLHAQVIPAESYTTLPDNAQRTGAIALLQQRATALDDEIQLHQQAQESLRRRDAELADVLENAIEGVQQIDADQVIRWANRAMMQMLGYTPDEYIGHAVSDFYVDSNIFAEYWELLTGLHEVRDFPAELRCRDGSTKHVVVNSNWRREDGQFLRTHCFVRDVTEQRRMEIQLIRNNQELRRALASRDEFISVAAHELKTPITSLRAYAQLLLRQAKEGHQPDSERLNAAIKAMEMQTGKLMYLVANVLNTLEIDDGSLVLEPEPTDLVALIHAVMRREFASSHHRVMFISPESCVIEVDPRRIEQAIVNLIDNAVKFSPAGGSIVIELEPDVAEDVRLTVTDPGVGIPTTSHETIFDRFSQAHSDRHLSGIGLGLYVAREIIRLHGGDVWCEDGASKGTRFVVSLPEGVQQQDPAAVTPEDKGKPRVLVVDDDESIRQLLSFVLSDEGFVVDLAVEGEEALDLIRRQHPDLILLDMKMPGIDGWEFVQRYRQLFGHRAPIVVFTAAQNPSKRGADVEADGYIAKPFELDVLIERIQDLIDRKPGPSSPTKRPSVPTRRS